MCPIAPGSLILLSTMHSFAGLLVGAAFALSVSAQTQAPVWGQCMYYSPSLVCTAY